MIIHSLESLGAVDGPGLRCVIFLQGCPLRCRYCHNPDTQDFAGGREVTLDELRGRLQRLKGYFGKDYAPRPFDTLYRATDPTGGVTLSGGDPLANPATARALIALCHAEGIHVAVDTAGGFRGDFAAGLAAAREADMLILDIKHPDPAKCRQLTGRGLEGAYALLDQARRLGQSVWIRHVAVPGWSDVATVDALRACLAPYPCVRKVELIGFHRLGVEKYAALARPYPMGNTPDFPADQLALMRQRLLSHKKRYG